jgi:hypothetical protein
MISFACDCCGRVKSQEEVWVLGLAAEAVGVTASRREVAILSAWDWTSAVHPLAVHFCCVACKNEYLVQLFGEEGLRKERAMGRVVRRIPGNPGTTNRAGPSARRKNRRHKKAA